MKKDEGLKEIKRQIQGGGKKLMATGGRRERDRKETREREDRSRREVRGK